MACAGRFDQGDVVCMCGVGAYMCLYMHTQVMNVLRIANVYNNPSAMARIPPLQLP